MGTLETTIRSLLDACTYEHHINTLRLPNPSIVDWTFNSHSIRLILNAAAAVSIVAADDSEASKPFLSQFNLS